MKIVEGFEKAKSLLLRRTDFSQIKLPLRVRQKLNELFGSENPEQAVIKIVDDVRINKDRAIVEYTYKIDRIKLDSIEVSSDAINTAYESLGKGLLSALKLAAKRIREFHQAQKDNVCAVDGRDWAQLIRPLNRVGIYTPGGTASYPSTVLMTAIPAKVAGVKETILVTPPGPSGKIPQTILAASKIAGVSRVFAVGGAQAIAALAYGTESIPRVDKICGPGNIFVQLAKRTVFGSVDIDALQGPSEVLIIADETADPSYCAADLIAQAEHDLMAVAILVTTSRTLAKETKKQVEKQLKLLPRRQIITESINTNGLIAVVDNVNEAVELANIFAPEHLELITSKPEKLVDRINNAGCIFLGAYSPVAMGDYIAGPNHSLPTSGTARFASPLGYLDFVKFIDIVKFDKSVFTRLAKPAMAISEAEGLRAHSQAITTRIKSDRP